MKSPATISGAFARNDALDALAQPLDLPAAAARGQREVHADAMQRRVPARDRHFAVEQPALLEAVRGDVLVVPVLDRKARQDGVAVVAVVVDRVAPVGEIAPHRVGEELVLRLDRPVAVARGLALVRALHFLQENDVGAERAQPIAQLVDHQPPIEERQALVDVVGDDVQRCASRWLHVASRSGAQRTSARGAVRTPRACGRARCARARLRAPAP